MKKELLICTLVLTLFGSAYSTNAQRRCEKCEQEEFLDEEAAIVLTNFAGMIGSFINIVQNPDNARNVGRNLGDMIHGIGNIVSMAIKRGKPIEDYIRSNEFKEQVRELIAKKVRPLP